MSQLQLIAFLIITIIISYLHLKVIVIFLELIHSNIFCDISFAAAGAGLTGTKMARRIGDVEEFEFKAIGENHNQGVSLSLPN